MWLAFRTLTKSMLFISLSDVINFVVWSAGAFLQHGLQRVRRTGVQGHADALLPDSQLSYATVANPPTAQHLRVSLVARV